VIGVLVVWGLWFCFVGLVLDLVSSSNPYPIPSTGIANYRAYIATAIYLQTHQPLPVSQSQSQAAQPDEPAHLRIRTQSGSVRVAFAVPEAGRLGELMGDDGDDDDDGSGINLPPRPYALDIETTSGPISGRFIFTAAARLVSTEAAGSITATLIPIVYHDNDQPRNISVNTQTQTASQQIRATEPIDLGCGCSSGTVDRNRNRNRKPDTRLATGSHTTSSGSLHIVYYTPGSGREGSGPTTSQGLERCESAGVGFLLVASARAGWRGLGRMGRAWMCSWGVPWEGLLFYAG
jgi:hypothetical protein